MIECKQVTFRYRPDAEPALDDVSLTIESGESIVIMGPNGSGKSTLARLLSGLIKAQEGEVVINGEPVGRGTDLSTVGILFQNPDNQMVAMVVDKEVAFALENKATPLKDMEQTVSDTLARFGIDHLRQRLTSELSGGEKQRVALAAATVCRPTVLILDEPDSFLDAAGRLILREELTGIRQAIPEMIEIRVTQFPLVARRSIRLIVMDKGRIIADGPPDEIFADRELCRRASLRLERGNHLKLSYPAVLTGTSSPGTDGLNRVTLKGISFGYSPSKQLFSNLDFELKAGETVGLVGPTGSGKSSLGLLLCSLLKPTSGEMAFLDRSGQVISRSGRPGWISGVLQLPERQFFLSSCAREVGFGPENLGRPLSEAEIRAYFELVGLDPDRFAERDPFSLSVGEKRRLAFAAVLSMQPVFVVFDEPTASLDQEGVGRFISMSRKLREHGMGQVIISHDGDVIESLADRIVLLKGDRTCRQYQTSEFFADSEYDHIVTRLTSD